jgi:predicted amidohydrolase YtcJ
MTHLYTILVRGIVLPGGAAPAVSAIAWAGDTVIGLGSEDAIRGLSRGDSRFIELDGACVVPVGDGEVGWPVDTTLEVGGPANLAILDRDPRHGAAGVIAVVRGGLVVTGGLPGEPAGAEHNHAHPGQDESAVSGG